MRSKESRSKSKNSGGSKQSISKPYGSRLDGVPKEPCLESLHGPMYCAHFLIDMSRRSSRLAATSAALVSNMLLVLLR